MKINQYTHRVYFVSNFLLKQVNREGQGTKIKAQNIIIKEIELRNLHSHF